MRPSFLLLPLVTLTLSVGQVNADQLLLTGQIASAKSQRFTVPKAGDSWRYQIQWMLPEGQLAKVGQTVVIFDKSQIDNQIEQLEATLLRVTAQEQSQQNELQASVLQARFNLKKARLELEKAQLEAEIPADFIAAKEYAENQFKLLQAQAEVSKAVEANDEAKARQTATLRKLALDREEAQLKLDRAMADLDSLELRARFAGPMLYAHNWNTNRKSEVGDTVQVGRLIASIPAMDGLQVKAWVNEVDIDKLAVGDSAQLRLDAQLDRSFAARIARISSQAQKKQAWGQSNWFEVDLSIDEKDLALQPGMSVQVLVEGSNG
ncbi:MAG: HlyD family efflux transporter periplasmic adaptor subunit [Shewanella sp.]|nr:HlyD family efflux transporter periplasmic adaptor subunit [Shewanella sp.]MCF1430510.1 HlyD family efflux transporter periplasmic adaptor subunit [Shewanella sp.]MCF1438644.1 HlyD family efflux transporter periplasmic adaptor subunit [Shewanella sp.]MCF1457421.1 HlyD family efflux transporter periplasmic adaptor subunit [Shewanella sp.]